MEEYIDELIIIIGICLIILFISVVVFSRKIRNLKGIEEKNQKETKRSFKDRDKKINVLIEKINFELGTIKELEKTTKATNLDKFSEINGSIRNINQAIINVNNELNKKIDVIDNYNNGKFEKNDEEISKLTDLIEQTSSTSIDHISQVADALLKQIFAISQENIELRKKLEHFSEIEDDSKNLNETFDIEKENELIQKILNKKTLQADINTKENSFLKTKDDDDEIIKKVVDSKEISEIPDKDVDNNEIVDEINNIDDQQTEIDEKNEISNETEGLDVQQEKAFYGMENSKNNLFISGKAGTGKSFLLKVFSASTKKKHLIVAPTGIAALNVNGTTIHSTFGYNNLKLDSNLDIIKLKNEKKEVLRNLEVLIIDEISMVRSDVLDKIDQILRKLNHTEQVFGGKQIILFGDLFQLPPIAKYTEYKYLNEVYNGIYFFYSKAYSQGEFNYIELTHNHRQNEDFEFFNILNKVREGKATHDDIKLLNSRYAKDEELRRVLKLFPKKEKVEIINNEELNKINAKEYQFDAIVEYSKNGNLKGNLESMFPINTCLKLKLGALVMMVKNDKDKRWVNGTLGIISNINQNLIKVTIDGIEHTVDYESFESKEAKYDNGRIHYETVYKVRQYPLVLAYAITIHKSQGMTYKKVACDLSETFASGQSYVALSRCSSLKGLHLMNKISGNEIETSFEIRNFYNELNGKQN